MSHDSFEEGAWIRGRIYEEKCDLSPDGKLFVYFVLQGNRSGTSYTHAWTAVSRPPWLTALTLWPQGSTYGGGGRFTADRDLVIRTGSLDKPHPDHPVCKIRVSSGNPDYSVSASHDHLGRIIYTKGGKLFRRIGEDDVELADFNGQTPNPQPAPAWAHHMPKKT